MKPSEVDANLHRQTVAEEAGARIRKPESGWIAYVGDTRFTVYHIYSIYRVNALGEEEFSEWLSNEYPELSTRDVQLAIQYAESNPSQMENVDALHEDMCFISEYQKYKCSCGELFDGNSEYVRHAGSNFDHHLVETNFQGVLFECSCGDVLEDVTAFSKHRRQYADHRLVGVHEQRI